MSTKGYPKRGMQMLWLAAGLLFTVAVIRSTAGGDTSTKEFIQKGYNAVTGNAMTGGAPIPVAGGAASDGWEQERMSLKDAFQLSERMWAKDVKKRHDMIAKDYGHVSKMPLYPSIDGTSYYQHPYTVWDFTPASFACPHEMERIGRMGDGGKWVCGFHRYEKLSKQRKCVIYSFGVRDESSFENEFLSRTDCEIWAYDFTVVDFGAQVEAKNRAKATFKQVGIAGKTDETKTPPFYSIQDLMKMNGHDYIDVLKMDIEFFEFESMDSFTDFHAGKELPIGQFMVEVHMFNGQTSEGYLKWFEKLEAHGMRPTWVEYNLVAVTVNVEGNKMPNMAEYVFVNAKDSRSMLFGGLTL